MPRSTPAHSRRRCAGSLPKTEVLGFFCESPRGGEMPAKAGISLSESTCSFQQRETHMKDFTI